MITCEVLEMVDYIAEFPGAIAAQGKGYNFLALRKIPSMRRADGRRATFEIEHRYLSQKCLHEKDQAWACVQGQEFTFWQYKEARKFLRSKKQELFKSFRLF